MSEIRTDLAAEAREVHASLPGVIAREDMLHGFPVTRVEVQTAEGAEKLGKPRGIYMTLSLDAYVRRREGAFGEACAAVADCVRPMLPREGPILVAALGNEAVTPDALGPLTARQLCVTRHMLQSMPEAFRGFRPVACVTPGVLGTTGIESAELIRGAAAHIAFCEVEADDRRACGRRIWRSVPDAARPAHVDLAARIPRVGRHLSARRASDARNTQTGISRRSARTTR